MKNGYQFLGKCNFLERLTGIVNEVARKDVVTFCNTIDMTLAEAYRFEVMTHTGIKPSYTALVIKAVSKALREFPEANRLVIKMPFFKQLVQFRDIDATVAVEREMLGPEQMVMTGFLRNSDKMPIDSMTKQLREFATIKTEDVPMWKDFLFLMKKVPACIVRVILGLPRFSPKLWLKWRGGSFAVTSPAKYGVDTVAAKWPHPLTFAFGLIKKRPVVVDDQVEARLSMNLTMAFDRSLITGAPAARFFGRIKEILENAIEELGESTSPSSLESDNSVRHQSMEVSRQSLTARF